MDAYIHNYLILPKVLNLAEIIVPSVSVRVKVTVWVYSNYRCSNCLHANDVPKLLEVIKSDNKLNRGSWFSTVPNTKTSKKTQRIKRKERKEWEKRRRKQIRVLRLKNRQKERRWKACATERVKGVLKNNEK